MLNLDNIVSNKEKICPENDDWPFRMLIIGPSGSGKTNTLLHITFNRKFKAIVKELFIRCRKLNISIVFITQSYFRTPKDARLNSTHYIIMKIGNKKELKSIAEENSFHLDFKDFLKIYNYCTSKPYSFMMVDTRLNARVTFKIKLYK